MLNRATEIRRGNLTTRMLHTAPRANFHEKFYGR
jgi:hypothetical protein